MTNEQNTAGELPALPKPAVPAMQRGYPGMQPSYTQPDYYTAEQIRERDAMWQAKLDALAASHCAQGEAIGGVVAEQFDILRRIADRGKRIALQKEDGPQVDINQHMLDEIERLAKMVGRPSHPADKPAGQAVTDARSKITALLNGRIRSTLLDTSNGIDSPASMYTAAQAVCDIDRIEKLLAALAPEPATPAAAVPDAMTLHSSGGITNVSDYMIGGVVRTEHDQFASGWNQCRKAMLAAAPNRPADISQPQVAQPLAAHVVRHLAARGWEPGRSTPAFDVIEAIESFGETKAAPAAAVPDGFLSHIASVCRGTIENCQPKPQRGSLDERHHNGRRCLNELAIIADDIDKMIAAAPNRPADAQRDKIAQVLKLLDNVTALQASEDYGLCEAIELLQGESALSADRIRTVLKLLGNVTAPTDDQADFLGQAEIMLENMLDALPEVSP